jgi:hypothetical protein
MAVAPDRRVRGLTPQKDVQVQDVSGRSTPVVEAAQLPWRPLGELFVGHGLISDAELEEALAEQAATGGRLGEILVKRNLISSPELTEALMEQLGREVAKEEGFGSGLWSEIQRRNARQGDEPLLALVVDEERPMFGGALAQEIETSAGTNGQTEPVEPMSDSMDVDAVLDPQERRRLAPPDVESLREQLAERDRRISDLGREIAELRAAKEKKANRRDTGRLEQDLDVAQREIHVRGARLSELEETLARRDERIGELERMLSDAASREPLRKLESERDAEERDARAESRRRAELAAAAANVWKTVNSRRDKLETRLAEELAGHAETRDALAEALDELGRLQNGHRPATEPEPEAEYIAFAPGPRGYRLVERTGPFPAVGACFEVDGNLYVVTRTGRSPLPSDARRCAYLNHS